MRFKSKRTIPGKSKKVIKFFFCFLVLLIFSLIVAGAARSLFLLVNRGPEIIKTRLAQVLKMDVELEKISISYPNVLSLHSLHIKENGASIFKSKKIDCCFTWQILQRKIQFQDIAILDSYIHIKRYAAKFSFSPAAFSKLINKLSNNRSQNIFTLDPTKWPIHFDLQTVSFQNSNLLLTDKKKEVPSLNGIFDIDLTFSESNNSIYPQKGAIIIKKGAFTHNGLSGTLQGSVELVKNLASPSLSINIQSDNSIKLHGAIRDYLTDPVCKIVLDGYQIDFSFLEALQFPFMPPQSQLKINGEMEFTDTTLYNALVPSLRGIFSFANGRWSVAPFTIELSDNVETLSGSLVLDAANSDPLRSWDKNLTDYGTLNFMLTGSTLPKNPLRETLHKYADKIDKNKLTSISVELGIRNQQGKLYISSASIESKHGSMIMEGKMNPQLTDLEMSGTYIIPKSLTSITKKTASKGITVKENEIIVPVEIKGTLLEPEINSPQPIKARNNQKASVIKTKKTTVLRPSKRKKKKQ